MTQDTKTELIGVRIAKDFVFTLPTEEYLSVEVMGLIRHEDGTLELVLQRRAQ